MPCFPILNSDLPQQKERMEALKTAQAEMSLIIAERRVLEALIEYIPSTADRIFRWEEEVLVYSELKKE